MFKYCGWGILLIFCRNDSMYRILTSFGSYFCFIYNVTLNSVILRILHHLWADLTRFICIYIYKWYVFGKAQISANDYFAPNSFSAKEDTFVFSCYLVCTTDDVEHPWYICSLCELLGVWIFDFMIFWSMQRSPTCY